jgi:uncharacterized protein (TIGR00251 family)
VPAAERTPWRVLPDGVSITVRVSPKAGRDGVEGIDARADGSTVLKVKVRAAPSEGAANAALIRVLADALGIAPSRVALIAGATARIKRLKVEGEAAVLAAALARMAGGTR